MKTPQTVRLSRDWPKTATLGNVTVRIYMVSIKGQTFYQVADRTAGKRRLQTFKEERAALAEATRIAQSLATGQSHAAGFSAADAASYGRAIQLLKPTGVPLETAAAAFAEAFKILGGNLIVAAARDYARRNPASLPDKRVAEVVAELLQVKADRGASKRYIGDLRHRLGRFGNDFQMPIATATGPMIQAWLDALKLSPVSAENFRRAVGVLFSFAAKRGYLPRGENPAREVERAKVKHQTPAIYAPGEMAALLAAAESDFVPALVLAGFCGLRSAEIERLQWQAIDLVEKVVRLEGGITKTVGGRTVPLPDNAAAWLAPYAGRTGPVWPRGHEAFYDAQARTAAAAGVPWKHNALRHSYGSYRVALLNDPTRVAGEMGNSPAVVSKHYKQLTKPSAAAQWFAITPKQPVNVTQIPTQEAIA